MLVVQVGPEVQEVLLVCSESRPMVEIRSELVLLEPPVEVDPLVEPEVDHHVEKSASSGGSRGPSNSSGS